MEFKTAFYSIIVISVVIIASGVILSGWSDTYDSDLSYDLEKDLDKMSEVSSEAESQKGKINPQSGEASSDFETETFRGGYGIITNIFAPLRIIYGDGGMIDSIMTRFGIPTYIWQAIVVMIIFGITATIIAIIFRRTTDRI